jgi:hypothetical protein
MEHLPGLFSKTTNQKLPLPKNGELKPKERTSWFAGQGQDEVARLAALAVTTQRWQF